jgi:preprotein translocase subunit Sss1
MSASNHRVSARQDWDCKVALEQKANELCVAIYDLESHQRYLEEELDVVLNMLRKPDRENDARDPTIATSSRCLSYAVGFILIGMILGLFTLGILNAIH